MLPITPKMVCQQYVEKTSNTFQYPNGVSPSIGVSNGILGDTPTAGHPFVGPVIPQLLERPCPAAGRCTAGRMRASQTSELILGGQGIGQITNKYIDYMYAYIYIYIYDVYIYIYMMYIYRYDVYIYMIYIYDIYIIQYIHMFLKMYSTFTQAGLNFVARHSSTGILFASFIRFPAGNRTPSSKTPVARK